jgi:hypothetical protein
MLMCAHTNTFCRRAMEERRLARAQEEAKEMVYLESARAQNEQGKQVGPLVPHLLTCRGMHMSQRARRVAHQTYQNTTCTTALYYSVPRYYYIYILHVPRYSAVMLL